MADDVHISGFGRGVPLWATEDTLREVAKYLRIQTDMRDVKDEKKKEAEQKRNANDTLKESKKTNFLMGSLGKTFEGLTNAVITGDGALTTVMKRSLQDLTGSLNKSGGVLGGVVAGLIVATVKFTGFINDTNNLYREMYSSGVSLDGSFINLIRSAGNANLSMIEFSSIASQNARIIAAMEGPYGNAANTFGMFIKGVRDSLYSVGQLGYTTSDITELMHDYMETQRLMMFDESVTAKSREKTIKEYLYQVDQLSQLTGKSRRQISMEMQAALRTPQLSAFLATQSEEIKKGMSMVVSSMSAASEPLGRLAAEIMQFGGPMSQDTAVLFNNLGTVGSEIVQMRNSILEGGKISNTQMTDTLRSWAGQTKQLIQINGEQIGAAAQVSGEYQTLIGVMQDLSSNTGKVNTGFSDNITRLLNNIDYILDRALGPVTQKIAMIFESLAGGQWKPLDRFASFVSGTLMDTIDWFVKWMNDIFTMETMESVSKEILKQAILAGKFLSEVWDVIKVLGHALLWLKDIVVGIVKGLSYFGIQGEMLDVPFKVDPNGVVGRLLGMDNTKNPAQESNTLEEIIRKRIANSADKSTKAATEIEKSNGQTLQSISEGIDKLIKEMQKNTNAVNENGYAIQ